jgi:hypothetical protein
MSWDGRGRKRESPVLRYIQAVGLKKTEFFRIGDFIVEIRIQYIARKSATATYRVMLN